MADTVIMRHPKLTLRPDPARIVIRPFTPSDPAAFAVEGHPRHERIAQRILSLADGDLAAALDHVRSTLAGRHRDLEEVLLRRFDELDLKACEGDVGRDRALLIGAYFSEEYSYEAAALFNPSVVRHDDQSGLPEGALRFVMSLRGIGEGHVSSVTFRTGVWGPDGITVDPPSDQSVPPRIERDEGSDGEGAITLCWPESRDVSETVLFPILQRQAQGIEDMRLVTFTEDDGRVRKLGTYTAFGGGRVRQELIEAADYHNVTMYPLTGAVADAKGLALFPRRIDGRYMALGRQDNENIWLLASDDLFAWPDGGRKLITPRYPWEYIQMGNCGAPIELDEGWLVLTHGVGMVRNYCMGAALLDRNDPSKLLARTPRPLLEPVDNERDGYVPNVVYSCGALVNGRELLLPYGVADYFTAFATARVDDILAAME